MEMVGIILLVSQKQELQWYKKSKNHQCLFRPSDMQCFTRLCASFSAVMGLRGIRQVTVRVGQRKDQLSSA